MLPGRRRIPGVKKDGAGDEIRTRDIDLGKVALYQLSYSRLKNEASIFPDRPRSVKPERSIHYPSIRCIPRAPERCVGVHDMKVKVVPAIFAGYAAVAAFLRAWRNAAAAACPSFP